MPARRLVAAVLAFAALAAAPGPALAQSGGAGSDQYVDPFGGNSQQHSGSGSKGSGSTGSSSAGASSGPALSATPTLTASSGQASPAAAGSGQTLPRTGADAGLVAAIGLALLLAGAALRLRLRPRDDRL